MGRDKESRLDPERLKQLRNHPVMKELIADLKKQSPGRVDQLVTELTTLAGDEGNDSGHQ